MIKLISILLVPCHNCQNHNTLYRWLSFKYIDKTEYISKFWGGKTSRGGKSLGGEKTTHGICEIPRWWGTGVRVLLGGLPHSTDCWAESERCFPAAAAVGGGEPTQGLGLAVSASILHTRLIGFLNIPLACPIFQMDGSQTVPVISEDYSHLIHYESNGQAQFQRNNLIWSLLLLRKEIKIIFEIIFRNPSERGNWF